MKLKRWDFREKKFREYTPEEYRELKQIFIYGPLAVLLAIPLIWVYSVYFGPSAINANGRDLYDVLKSIHPNTPGRFEDEYVDGEVISKCIVGGKYNAYYGWVKIVDTFIAGRPVHDDNPATIYLFVTDLGDHWQMVKAGDMNKEDVFSAMRWAGCEVPKQ